MLQIVGINPETVSNVTSHDFPHHYIGEDHAWKLETFRDVSGTCICTVRVSSD